MCVFSDQKASFSTLISDQPTQMASSKAITYAPNVDFTMESVDLTKNNVVGNFAYPEGFPNYRDVVKYLQNCFLSTAFTKTPSIIYHEYLREFWCTTVVVNPDVPKNATIKFTVKHGTKPLMLNYKTFVKATCLDYTVNFAAQPKEDDAKTLVLELGPYDKFHPDVTPGALLAKAPILKAWFPAPWRILMTFVIQVLGVINPQRSNLTLLNQ